MRELTGEDLVYLNRLMESELKKIHNEYNQTCSTFRYFIAKNTRCLDDLNKEYLKKIDLIESLIDKVNK